MIDISNTERNISSWLFQVALKIIKLGTHETSMASYHKWKWLSICGFHEREPRRYGIMPFDLKDNQQLNTNKYE